MEESAAAMTHLRRLQYLRDQEQRRKLTDDEISELDQHQQCQHCGGFHVRSCARVQSVSFHLNGKIASVTYWNNADVDWSYTVFADQGADGSPQSGDSFTEDMRLVLAPYWRLAAREAGELVGDGKGSATGYLAADEHEMIAARRLLLLLDTAGTVQSGDEAR
jgi:hypothetical protein